jgi:hypothetical protein
MELFFSGRVHSRRNISIAYGRLCVPHSLYILTTDVLGRYISGMVPYFSFGILIVAS